MNFKNEVLQRFRDIACLFVVIAYNQKLSSSRIAWMSTFNKVFKKKDLNFV